MVLDNNYDYQGPSSCLFPSCPFPMFLCHGRQEGRCHFGKKASDQIYQALRRFPDTWALCQCQDAFLICVLLGTSKIHVCVNSSLTILLFFLISGAVDHYELPMDIILGQTVINPSGLDARAHGNPSLISGVVNRAIQLDTPEQYVNISGPGHRYECFGDLDLCDMGKDSVWSL